MSGERPPRFPPATRTESRRVALGHSATEYSASTRAKSASSVTFIARSLPRTTTTSMPEPLDTARRRRWRSRARRALRRYASLDHVARKGLRRLRAPERARGRPFARCVPSSSTSFSVSTTGSAATAPCPARASAMTRSIVAIVDERARRVVHERRSATSSGRSSRPFATPTRCARALRSRPAGGRRRTGRATAADRRRSCCGSTHTTIADVGRALKASARCAAASACPPTQRNCLSSSPPDARAAARRRR